MKNWVAVYRDNKKIKRSDPLTKRQAIYWLNSFKEVLYIAKIKGFKKGVLILPTRKEIICRK